MTIPSTSAVPTSASSASLHEAEAVAHRGDLLKVAIGALGVVYGDIGTSPLYAFRECFAGAHAMAPTPANVLGLLSLFFWALTFVVSIKYLVFVMRADNHGEGGVLALMSLLLPQDEAARTKRTLVLILLGLFGAALLYGDGVITPAISVLSAVEGLEVVTSAFSPVVLPITCVILIALFVVQRRGTGGIGAVFGPVTLLWFVAIAAMGVPYIVRRPDVLLAINPLYAVRFFAMHGWAGALVLGAVVLCITGGEALYADMGHFGRKPIRTAWWAVVFPALLIDYFGQGALVLAHPEASANPFYALVPAHWLMPMVTLATLATVIASQALISGAFSLSNQAVQLGYLPRLTVIHTSGRSEGQIYIPEVNWLLMVACLALVLGFRRSSALANAYGIAVTATMGLTSVLFFAVARTRWKWSTWKAGGVVAMFLFFDLAFLGACLSKFVEGGWFPVAVAGVVFVVLTTWKKGRALLSKRIARETLPLEMFLADVGVSHPHRVRGTAVFLASLRRGTPTVLLHHFKHNQVLHEQVVILSVVTDAVPEVSKADRVHAKKLTEGFWAVTAHYGFMETPNVPDVLLLARRQGLRALPESTSYYLGRETLICRPGSGLAQWRKRLFGFLSRNGRSATDFFGLPPGRVIEVGVQIEF
jgi:KUP system potassium uptake protein